MNYRYIFSSVIVALVSFTLSPAASLQFDSTVVLKYYDLTHEVTRSPKLPAHFSSFNDALAGAKTIATIIYNDCIQRPTNISFTLHRTDKGSVEGTTLKDLEWAITHLKTNPGLVEPSEVPEGVTVDYTPTNRTQTNCSLEITMVFTSASEARSIFPEQIKLLPRL